MSGDPLSDIVRAGYEPMLREALAKPLFFEQLAPKREGPPPPQPIARQDDALDALAADAVARVVEFNGYRLVLELASGRRLTLEATGYECDGLDVELWEDGGSGGA